MHAIIHKKVIGLPLTSDAIKNVLGTIIMIEYNRRDKPAITGMIELAQYLLGTEC